MLFFLGSGVIVSVPMALFFEPNPAFLNSFLNNQFEAVLLGAAVVAPFVEEFAKAYPLFYRHGESQRSLCTLGILVGFGFGIVEFFAYVLSGVPWQIRLPGVFFHASSTTITAFGIAAKRSLPFYLMAVLLHGSFNFLESVGESGLAVLVLVAAYGLAGFLYLTASEKIVAY